MVFLLIEARSLEISWALLITEEPLQVNVLGLLPVNSSFVSWRSSRDQLSETYITGHQGRRTHEFIGHVLTATHISFLSVAGGKCRNAVNLPVFFSRALTYRTGRDSSYRRIIHEHFQMARR